MQHNNQILEWYTKEEILKIYPIGISTYKKRIKVLKNPEYKDYTRFVEKNLSNSNLKKIKIREIHKSILNDLFGKVRTPSLKDRNKMNKWIKNIIWDWFCNIKPVCSLPKDLKDKIEYFYYQLKQIVNEKSNLMIFYSIEPNLTNRYFHCHFLIKCSDSSLTKKMILDLLAIISDEKNRLETRTFVEKYEYEIFYKSGSGYSAKDMMHGYDLLK